MVRHAPSILRNHGIPISTTADGLLSFNLRLRLNNRLLHRSIARYAAAAEHRKLPAPAATNQCLSGAAGRQLKGSTMTRTVSAYRSVTKTITYRILIMSFDFLTTYPFTGAVRIAVGFMIASNVYTTLGYLIHERIWARISWGIENA